MFSMSLEVATIIVPILEVKKPKFREEKLSDLSKVTQLISIELDLNPSSCVPNPHSEPLIGKKGDWGGVGVQI